MTKVLELLSPGLLLAPLLIGACTPRGEGVEPFEPTQELRDQVTTALHALLSRKNNKSFVIVFVEGSDRFVQFAMDPEGLFLDFPTNELSREEMKRAHHLFDSAGGYLREIELVDSSSGEPRGSMKAFRIDLDHDAGRGADLALLRPQTFTRLMFATATPQ